MVIFGIIYLME